MIVLEGDTVRLKSGETALVQKMWGVARTWCRLQITEGQTLFVMAERIDAVIDRPKKKKRWK